MTHKNPCCTLMGKKLWYFESQTVVCKCLISNSRKSCPDFIMQTKLVQNLQKLACLCLPCLLCFSSDVVLYLAVPLSLCLKGEGIRTSAWFLPAAVKLELYFHIPWVYILNSYRTRLDLPAVSSLQESEVAWESEVACPASIVSCRSPQIWSSSQALVKFSLWVTLSCFFLLGVCYAVIFGEVPTSLFKFLL